MSSISISCSSTKNIADSNIQPTKFVFKEWIISSESGILKLKSKNDSLVDANYSPNGEDSLLYKLTLIIKDLKTDFDFGNTIYEMYVTDRFNLPIHTVINLTQLISNTFPLEINMYEENLPGIVQKYELVEFE